MMSYIFQKDISAQRKEIVTLFVLDMKIRSNLVKLTISCVFLHLLLLKHAFISQFLQKCNNKDHFQLPHSALDSGVPRILLVCAGPQVLVPVHYILCKCVSIKFQSEQYVCIPPNMLLLD